MTDSSGDQVPPILHRWADLAHVEPPPLHRGSRRASGVAWSLLVGVVAIAMIAIARAPSQPGSGLVGRPSTSPSDSASDAERTPSSSFPSPSATAGATPPPSLGGSAEDEVAAFDVATRFETARASGQWNMAWNLLAPYAQLQIGTVAAFAGDETSYNAGGGSIFDLQGPTQNPDLLSHDWLGSVYDDIAVHGDVARAWVVVVRHPDVNAASAATTTLVVAPVGSAWLVWIGH